MEKQRTVGSMVLTAFVTILAFAGTRYVVTEIRQERAVDSAIQQYQDGSFLVGLRSGAVTPYDFVVIMENAGGAAFRRNFAEGTAINIRRSMPGAQLRIDDHVRTQDLGTAWRGVLGYSGRVAFEEGSPALAIQGEALAYYHPDGGATIETFCIEEFGACNAAFRGLVAEAETRLLGRLSLTSLDGVLPDSDDCLLDKVDVPNQDRTFVAAICHYDDGQMLTFSRLDRAEAADVFQAVAKDPEFEALMRRHLKP